MIISHVFEKHTFNPETNNIDVDYCVVDKKFKRSKKAILVLTAAILLSIIIIAGFTASIVCAALITEKAIWGAFSIFLIIGVDLLCNLHNKTVAKEMEEQNIWEQEKLQESLNHREATTEATNWRANHALEEHCRLAMTKNPNYVADLIKFVKEYKDEKNL